MRFAGGDGRFGSDLGAQFLDEGTREPEHASIMLERVRPVRLIGESADIAIIRTVWALLDDEPAIRAVNHVRTIHMAPDKIFVAISADFVDTLSMRDSETLIEQIEARMKAALPAATSIYIRPEKQRDAIVQPRP